jgi:hypothetical protein
MGTRLTLSLLSLVTACSAGPIEVGTGGSKTGGQLPPPITGGADNPPLAAWPEPDACAAQSNLAIKGIWNGYDGRFQNPAPDFRVDIRGASQAGGLCGTVIFEPAKPPPPPSADPAVMYPTEGDRSTYNYNEFTAPLLGGFAFTILEGRAQDAHAQIRVSRSQPWQAWCEPQPTYVLPIDIYGYGCLPSWGYGGGPDPFAASGCYMTDPESMGSFPINCGRLYLCHQARVCACNAARCVAKHDTDIDFALDFTANQATGTITSWDGNGDVLLVRVQ